MSGPGSADHEDVLICATCKGVIRFANAGWNHADPDRVCARLIIAWPPPVIGDEA